MTQANDFQSIRWISSLLIVLITIFVMFSINYEDERYVFGAITTLFYFCFLSVLAVWKKNIYIGALVFSPSKDSGDVGSYDSARVYVILAWSFFIIASILKIVFPE